MSGDQQLVQVQHVLDALNCGAALLDRDGIFVHINQRLCAMLGRAHQDMVGRNVREFYSDPAEQAYLDSALLRSDDAREAEFVLPRIDGSRIPVLTTARPLPAPLDHLHVVTIVDLSAQKRAEQELQENSTYLQQIGDNALEHAIELKGYSEALEKKVQERTEDLRLANLDAIYMLAVASEAKDADTGRHVRRIQKYAELLAHQIGMSDRDSHAVGLAAVLHDVGKIHIPDYILNKPGPLDENERNVMRTHTMIGERILSKRPFFEKARQIARHHHENWDASGYPDRIGENEIPLEARIVHIADVFDALTHPRVYKSAWPLEQAVEFISEQQGKMFDPDIAKAFTSLAQSDAIAQAGQSIEQALDR